MTTPNVDSQTRLLIVDDDRELLALLSRFLSNVGFVVSTAPDGETGLAMLEREVFDIVVLDVGLPRLNGLDVLRTIRSTSSVPVVMLTASGDLEYRIRGLAAGADDYLPKPFSTEELLLRVRAVLRRTEAGAAVEIPQILQLDDLVVDSAGQEVRCSGHSATLTPAELAIVRVLVERAGIVVSRDDLTRLALQRVSGAFDRSLDVHISRIRRKLGPRADGRPRIKTIRGEGYLLVRPTN